MKYMCTARANLFSQFYHGFLTCSENEEIKKSSLFTSTGWWRQFNGFYFTLGAISSHSWPLVTRGWKWHLLRDKNHFIFFTPVTVNRYSFWRYLHWPSTLRLVHGRSRRYQDFRFRFRYWYLVQHWADSETDTDSRDGHDSIPIPILTISGRFRDRFDSGSCW